MWRKSYLCYLSKASQTTICKPYWTVLKSDIVVVYGVPHCLDPENRTEVSGCVILVYGKYKYCDYVTLFYLQPIDRKIKYLAIIQTYLLLSSDFYSTPYMCYVDLSSSSVHGDSNLSFLKCNTCNETRVAFPSLLYGPLAHQGNLCRHAHYHRMLSCHALRSAHYVHRTLRLFAFCP